MRLKTTLQLAALFPILLTTLCIVVLFGVLYSSGVPSPRSITVASTAAVGMGVLSLVVGWRFYRVGEGLTRQIAAMSGLADRVRQGDLTPAEISHDADKFVGEVSSAAEVFSQLVGESRGYVDLIRAHEKLQRELAEAQETANRLRQAAVPVSSALERLGRAEQAVTHWLLEDNLFLLTWLPRGLIRTTLQDLKVDGWVTDTCDQGVIKAAVERLAPAGAGDDGPATQLKADVLQAIEDAIALCNWRWTRGSSQSRVEARISQNDAGSPTVRAEHSDLVHAFACVLINAGDAMPDGGTVAVELSTDDSGMVNVAITDPGLGMSATVEDRCMRAFFSTREGHLGIGLTLTARLVRRWGGRLGVMSEEGEGTTIHMSFERPRAGDEPATDASVVSRTSNPLGILIVEDDDATRETLVQLLSSDRHQVEAVADGAEAILRLRNSTFDVVMTDRAMPVMTGDELARVVRARHPMSSVVMVTGLGDVMDRSNEKPEGVDVVVAKPVIREDLRLALRRAAEIRSDRLAQGQRSV